MNRDRIFMAVVVFLVLATAAFFVNRADNTSENDSDSRLNPAGRGVAEPDNKTSRSVNAGPAPATEEKTKNEQNAAVETVELIETRDDMGARHAGLEFTVSNAEGEPLEGAKIEVFTLLKSHWTGVQRGGVVHEITTGPGGEARLDRVEARFNYAVHVSAPGTRQFRIPFLKPEAGRLTRHQVILSAGLTMKGNVVSSATLDPVPGASIAVYDLEDVTSNPEDAIEWAGESAADGTFVIDNLRPGPKRICVRADGFGSKTIPYLAVTPQSARAPLSFKLPSGAAIEGVVLDLEGKRLGGVAVHVSPLRGAAEGDPRAWYAAVYTDASGRFRCDGLLPGSYALRAAKTGYAPGNFGPGQGQKLRLSAANARAGDRGIKLFLGEGPKISGVVVDARDGLPVKAFDLYASTQSDPRELDPSSRQRFMSSDGRFEYAVHVVGTQSRLIYLHVEAPGYAGGRLKVDFTDPLKPQGQLLTRVENVKVRAVSGVSLSGRLTNASGAPIVGARVSARRRRNNKTQVAVVKLPGSSADSWARAISGVTDDKGRYEIRAVPDGSFRVSADHKDYAYQLLEERLEVTGEPVDMGVATMIEGGQVAGIVLDPEGRPQGSARILLEPAPGQPGEPFEWRTNLTGRFNFDHVPPGKFKLTVVERRGLDTRSAIYQELMKTRPDVELIEMKDGLKLQFEMRN